jgi:hypothetical protein
MEQQCATTTTLASAAPDVDDVDDTERKMQEIAEGVGGMRLEHGIMPTIVQDLLLRPQNLTAVVRTPEQMRNVIYARFGEDEARYLMHHDADFLCALGTAVADDDGRLMEFAKFVDSAAALSYRVPKTVVVGVLSNTGATLAVHSVLGISESGWAALFATTSSGRLRLYYMQERISLHRDADDAGEHYCWTRHPQLPDVAADELGAYAIHRDIVALWTRSKRTLLIASLDPARAPAVYREVECFPDDKLVVSAVVATERYATLLLDNMSVVFVWLTMPDAAIGASQIAGFAMPPALISLPAAELAHHPVPCNPFTGEKLEALEGLGGSNGGDKWTQKHHASTLAIDQHNENVVAIGTDCGYALFVEVGVVSTLRPIDWPLPMGEPPELELARGDAVRKRHPGLEPIESLCVRSPYKDGSVCSIMKHSLSIRCPRAVLVKQTTGVSTRIECAQEVNVTGLGCVQLNGLDLLVHNYASNMVMICNITPSPSRRISRYLVQVEQRFPCSATAYRSLYVSLAHATILMPDGHCLRVVPSNEKENAAYIREMMEKTAAFNAASATAETQQPQQPQQPKV